MRKLRVLDLSHYQTVSNLDGMKAAGIVGVIHKATEGVNYVDPKYAPRRQWFIENGFAFASYHFLRPGSLAAQMRHYIDVARPEEGEVVILDYEADGLMLGDLDAAVAWLRSYAPKNPICIYGGNLLEQHVGSARIDCLADTALWTAEYTTRDAPKWPSGTWPKWSLWQYSDGKAGGSPHDVAGVSQVDCNEFNGTDEECRAWFKRPAAAALASRPTIYELTWGSTDVPRETRYFTPDHGTDAVMRLAERVLELDKAPANAAFASLSRLPDSIYPEGMTLASWTKTSDERPTDEGSKEMPA